MAVLHCRLLCNMSSSHLPSVPSQLGRIEELCRDAPAGPDRVGLHVLVTSSGIVEWISAGEGMGWVHLTRRSEAVPFLLERRLCEGVGGFCTQLSI